MAEGKPAKAIIYKHRKQFLLRVPTFKTWYGFRHIAPNGEQIAVSEGYTAKHNAIRINEVYYPNFVIVDETGEK